MDAELVGAIEKFAHNAIKVGTGGAHSYEHTLRVRQLCLLIGKKEGADLEDGPQELANKRESAPKLGEKEEDETDFDESQTSKKKTAEGTVSGVKEQEDEPDEDSEEENSRCSL